jgi:hypothetical protein
MIKEADGLHPQSKSTYQPATLLLKKIRLPSIEILELRIHAERSREGEVHLLALIEQIRSNIARMQTEGPRDLNCSCAPLQ